METPTFISYFAEKIGKPVSAFTKADWQRAAMTAAEFLDNALPMPKKRGPKPKQITLRELLNPNSRLWQSLRKTDPKRPRGRPIQRYGRDRNFLIEDIAELVSAPEAPRSKTEAVKQILRTISNNQDDYKSVLRALRRQKSGHN